MSGSSILKQASRTAKSLIRSQAWRSVVFGLLVGVVSGLGAVVFSSLLEVIYDFSLNEVAGYYPPKCAGEGAGEHVVRILAYNWWLLVVPTMGGLLCGLIVYTWAPEAEGHGTDGMIDAFHNKTGLIRGRVPIVKTLASAITLGTGGAAGREGPIAQIGAGFASFLATKLKLSARERRILVIAGTGAGVGAIFRAPFAGALFATEVLYRDSEFEFEAIIPAIISSIVSYSVFCTVAGWGTLFDIPDVAFKDPRVLPLYILLGIACAAVGLFYIKFFYGVRDHVFAKIQIPDHFKPAIGGFALGVMAFFMPEVLGMGYGWVQEAIYGHLAIGFMLLMIFMRIVATSLTISSGGSGGVFVASVVIGGMLGGTFGQIFHQMFPGVVIDPASFVIVGMAGFFAGVAHVPISSLIMTSEMTGGYGLLVPMMLVSSVTHLLLYKWSLYENQVHQRVDSPAHLGDFMIDVLKGIKVRNVLQSERKVILIPEQMTLGRIMPVIANTTQNYFPVTDAGGGLVGIFSLDDVRKVFSSPALKDLIIARDLGTSDVITITPDEDLNSVLRKFTMKNLDEIPVVDALDATRFLGMLTRRAVIHAYNRELQRDNKKT